MQVHSIQVSSVRSQRRLPTKGLLCPALMHR